MRIYSESERLALVELNEGDIDDYGPAFFEQVVAILSPKVVQSLPAYFHGISNAAQAKHWLARVLSESHLFVVNDKSSSQPIGFVFVSNSRDLSPHLGYLLAEEFWGRGLAYELLSVFISKVKSESVYKWTKLNAGVETSNTASVNLLCKLGFTLSDSSPGGVLFFEYSFE